MAENSVKTRARHALGRLARRMGFRRPRAEPAPPQHRPKPEVALERTNYGRMMDELVARARRNQRCYGANPDYDLVREHFDHYHFMVQAVSLHDEPEADPIRIFLRSGANAINSPDPHFSMKNYLERYPEKREGEERSPYLDWLKRGREAGEIADPGRGIEEMAPLLGLEPQQIVDELVAVRSDLLERLRYGKLGEVFAKAAEVEPLIGALWPETAQVRLVPLGAIGVARAEAAIFQCHSQARFRRARVVVVTSRPRPGAARHLEGHLAHALVGTVAPDDLVVIYTDQSGPIPSGRFPDGVREVDFAAAGQLVPQELNQLALTALLRSFCADSIINLDSAALYSALGPYGRALATSERLFLCFQADEPRAAGNRDGWSHSSFYSTFEYAAGVITDTEHLRQELIERYQVSAVDAERISVLRAPVAPEIVSVPAPPMKEGRRRKVLWAGSWDRQSRADVAVEVARRMPDVDLLLWAESLPEGVSLGALPANARVTGDGARLADLQLDAVDAWLYTAARTGVPNVLLDIAMTGIPVVASQVGGVEEALTDTDAWPVSDTEDPEAYEKALREILGDPESARRRARALRERLTADRPRSVFARQAVRLLLNDDTGSTEANR